MADLETPFTEEETPAEVPAGEPGEKKEAPPTEEPGEEKKEEVPADAPKKEEEEEKPEA